VSRVEGEDYTFAPASSSSISIATSSSSSLSGSSHSPLRPLPLKRPGRYHTFNEVSDRRYASRTPLRGLLPVAVMLSLVALSSLSSLSSLSPSRFLRSQQESIPSPRRALSRASRLRGGGRKTVMGIDIGNQNTRVSIVTAAGVDTVLNEASKRLSPTIVACEGINSDSRAICTPMLSAATKNAISGAKRFIGKTFEDSDVEGEAKMVSTPIRKSEDTGKAAAVLKYGRYMNETFFEFESVYAMIMKKMQQIATKQAGENAETVDEAVITVPDYFDERQRRGVLDAAKIAGIKVLQLMSEHAATALTWGILRSSTLPETGANNVPVTVGFVDIGQSATTVYFVDFFKTEMKVRGVASDPNLGGRDLDKLLVEKFGEEFKKKFGCDYKTNQRAEGKLKDACEKAKKVLTTGTTATQVKIEFFMDGIDVKGDCNQDDFLKICTPFVDRLLPLIKRAKERANIDELKQISAIEMVGGGTRPKPIIDAIEKTFGKPVSRSLLQDECTSNGAAWQAAKLSPRFRVRDFGVSDVIPRPVTFEKHGGKRIKVFDSSKDPSIPSAKMLTYNHTGDFNVTAFYSGPGSYEPRDPNLKIGQWQIFTPEPNKTEGAEERVKLLLKYTENGVVDLEKAELYEQIQELVPAPTPQPTTPPPTTLPPTPVNASAVAAAAAKGERMAIDGEPEGEAPVPTAEVAEEEKMDAEENKSEPAEGNPSSKEASVPSTEPTPAPVKMEWVKRIYMRDLKFVKDFSLGLPEKNLKRLIETEKQFADHDQEIHEREDIANEFESHVLTMRDRIDSGNLASFTKEDEKTAIMEQIDTADDWLMTKGQRADKKELTDYLEKLKNVTNPILTRYKQSILSKTAFEDLMEAIADAKKAVQDTSPKKAHITKEERENVVNFAEDLDKWATHLRDEQAKIPGHEEPVLTVEILKQKEKELHDAVQQTMERPVPTPAPTPAPTTKDKKKDEKSVEKDEATEGPPKEDQKEEGNQAKPEETKTGEGAEPDPKMDEANDEAAGEKMEVTENA